jgi:hypothetical protein
MTKPLPILAFGLLGALLSPAARAQEERPPEYWENFKPSWSLNEPNTIRPQPNVGSSANAAIAYFQAWDMLPRKEWVRLNDLAGNRPDSGKPLPKELRDELLKQHAYIDALLRVSAMDHCDWGYAWESGWDLLLPHLGYCRGSARLLAAETLRCAQDNSNIAAIERIRAMVRISQHVAEGPILISSLVGMAISALAANITTELLDHHDVTPAQARALLAIFRAIPRKDFYNTSAALSKEREITIAWLRDKCPGKEPGAEYVRFTVGNKWNDFRFGEAFLSRFTRQQFDQDLTRAEKLYIELEKAWHSDNPEPRLEELAWEMNEFQWGLVAIQMMPSYVHARGSVTRLQSQLAALEKRLERLANQGNDSPIDSYSPPSPSPPPSHPP